MAVISFLLLLKYGILFTLELTEAYRVLGDLNSRRDYDKEFGAYFTLRSTKKKETSEKVLRLTDEMLEIDMSGIQEVINMFNYQHISCSKLMTCRGNLEVQCDVIIGFTEWSISEYHYNS